MTATRSGASLALRGVVALLVVNALVAIVAILSGGGDDAWRVVGTTMLLTAACLVVAANAGAVEKRAMPVVPYVATIAGIVAIGGLILSIWAEDLVDHDGFWKTVTVLLVVGATGTYASLVALPQLSASWEPARWCGWAAAAVLGALAIVAILGEWSPPAELIAVVSIVLATATIVVMVVAFANRRDDGGSGAATPDTPTTDASATDASTTDGSDTSTTAMTCPRCRSVVASSVTSGAHRCPSCGLAFTVHPPTAHPADQADPSRSA